MKNFLSELPQLWKQNDDEIFVVNIFSCGIKAAYLKRINGRLELQDWSIVYHADIRLTSDADIVNFIVIFVQKNAIKTKQVILSLADLEGVVFKETIVGNMEGNDVLGSAIKFQLAEDIKFDANLAQVGWKHLSDVKNEEGSKQRRVLALIVDRVLINRFVGIIEICKLYISVITSHIFHWESVLKNVEFLEDTCSVLDLQYASTTLNVYVGGKLYFSRHLSITLQQLIESLKGDAFDPSESIDKLLTQLFNVDFPGNAQRPEAEGSHRHLGTYNRLRPFLEIFGRDINLSFNYLSSRYLMAAPRQMFITGIGGNFKCLISFLKEKFGQDTLQFPAGHLFRVGSQDSGSLQYAQNTIIDVEAVALGDHQKVNLLPVEFSTKRIEKFQKVILSAVSVAVLLVFLYLIGGFQLKSVSNYTTLIEAYQKLHELEEIISINQGIGEREELNNLILSKEVPVDGILKQISNSVPKEIIVKRIFYDALSKEFRVDGKIGMNVHAKDALINRFSDSLEASPFFSKATVTQSQVVGESTEFQITCEFEHG